ncbi:MAG: TMEM175 family protein [bacterium]|nr:TMEM175 family protein [bacterium]
MKQLRLETLADGIFAIIITLLTFELRLPSPDLIETEHDLWLSVTELGPIFLSFILSFALLFTYWRAHHYIVSIYAKAVDARLSTINAVFFFFIALIPFSSRLLGEYSDLKLAIALYALNIICIGLSLIWMRKYVLASGYISHMSVKKLEQRRGVIRVMVPMVFALLAIAISFISTKLSFVLLTSAIVFNLMSRTTTFVNWIYESMIQKQEG